MIRIGREALAACLPPAWVYFQRTKTWKESTDPERDAELDRSEYIPERFPDRACAVDEFGPLGIRPTGGSCWAGKSHPDRVPATYHHTHGVTYFYSCHSVGDDTLWGVNRRHKGAVNSPAALKSRRTSGRCGSSPSPAQAVRPTLSRPGPCTPIWAGATPTTAA